MSTLQRLEATIAARMSAQAETSYVASLNAKGIAAVAQKLGEEATEAVIAAVSGSANEVVSESADLLFHLLVLLRAKGLSFDDVIAELERREGVSGIAEKASRNLKE
ncbi:MAG: phosphoribosyl-ATP diphosphatase [Pseudomonadota bacterium]